MGGKGGGAPKAPNYKKLAQQMEEGSKRAAMFQTNLNRPEQSNPFGSISWEIDPATGKSKQIETWDPRMQQAAQSGMDLQQDKMGDLLRQGDWTGGDDPQVKWDPEGYKKYGDAIYESAMNRVRPEQEREREQYNTRLLQQGLQPGTAAYDRAMQNMMTSHGDVASQAALNARVQGGQEYRSDFASQLAGQNQNYSQDLQNYQMPWDLAGASQGLTAGVTRPTFASFAGGTGYQPADLMGAAQAGYNAKMGNYNAKQQKKGNTMGAAAQLGGAAMMMSDERLKQDAEQLDGRQSLEALLALRGYRFRWKADGTPDGGVMAQEVQRILEEAVEQPDEYMRVNYTKLMALAVEAIRYLVKQTAVPA